MYEWVKTCALFLMFTPIPPPQSQPIIIITSLSVEVITKNQDPTTPFYTPKAFF